MNPAIFMHNIGIKDIHQQVFIKLQLEINLLKIGDYICGACSDITRNAIIISIVVLFTMVNI